MMGWSVGTTCLAAGSKGSDSNVAELCPHPMVFGIFDPNAMRLLEKLSLIRFERSRNNVQTLYWYWRLAHGEVSMST